MHLHSNALEVDNSLGGGLLQGNEDDGKEKEEKKVGKEKAPPTLMEICLLTLANHMNIFACIEDLFLPEEVLGKLIDIYRQRVMKERSSYLTDDKLEIYLRLLRQKGKHDGKRDDGAEITVRDEREKNRNEEEKESWEIDCKDATRHREHAVVGPETLYFQAVRKRGCRKDETDVKGGDRKRSDLEGREGDVGRCRETFIHHSEAETKGGAKERDGLVALNLPWAKEITHVGCSVIVRSCPFLRTLNLDYCSGVDDEAVGVLAKGLAQLESLSICFTKITDKGTGYLSSHSQGLKTLSLEECEMVTDLGVQRLARSLSNLTWFNVGGCSVTNVGVGCIASNAKGLRGLSLGGCSSVTDFDLQDISQGLTHLERISLRACRYVSDQGLGWLAKLARRQHKRQTHQRRDFSSASSRSSSSRSNSNGNSRRRRRALATGCLEKVDIGGCVRCSDKGVTKLLRWAPGLLKLDLRGTSITEKTLEEASHHPSLRSIVVRKCKHLDIPEGYEFGK